MAKIIYVYALADWRDNEVTPFQGFAPGLIDLVLMMELLPQLPSDVFEFTMEPADMLARRRAGEGAWLWIPVNLSTLLATRSPKPLHPFMVVFSGDVETARAICKWRKGLRIRPLHVSAHKVGGALHPGDLTIARLNQHCRYALRQARKADKRLDVTDIESALERWTKIKRRVSSLTYHSHNVTTPNEFTLIASGEFPAEGKDGKILYMI